jgi:extradiol dioxygenase family protein
MQARWLNHTKSEQFAKYMPGPRRHTHVRDSAQIWCVHCYLIKVNKMNKACLHLSIPVKDIPSTVSFYGKVLGCDVTRIIEDRADIDFFGHHLVAQLSPEEASHRSVNIGKNPYPLRHFGVIVETAIYNSMLANLRNAQTVFAMEPDRIFIGTPREQSVFLVFDPSGNALEVKGMDQPDQVFSKQ